MQLETPEKCGSEFTERPYTTDCTLRLECPKPSGMAEAHGGTAATSSAVLEKNRKQSLRCHVRVSPCTALPVGAR